MRLKLAFIVMLIVAFAVSGSAQKPAFSGKWEIDQAATDAASPPVASGAPGARLMRGTTGFPMTITQTGDSFVIERRSGDGGATTTTTYKLDGIERDVKTSQGSAKAKARWDGDKIITETRREGGVVIVTYTIDKSGLLWVETKGLETTTKRVYKKLA
jgi:hypothetical protein